ncbi:hypothetical protein [Halomonas sp. 25-S5]|uniref:hypothetical protein n=1 Tax=Halomonas sp. 25-S5 TaxID=2994065 RepID=UPI002468BADC|nr:hypothetical protein [Halomonas sp. 25-S5]
MAINNNIDLIYCISKGLSVQNFDKLPKFDKHTYKRLKRLSELVQYGSSFTVERQYLCDHLQVTPYNLINTLSFLVKKQLIEYETNKTNPDIPFGKIKVTICPSYVWSYHMTKTREQACSEWYLLRDLAETSKTDITLSPAYQDLVRDMS